MLRLRLLGPFAEWSRLLTRAKDEDEARVIVGS
jgi:hypothetical protein